MPVKKKKDPLRSYISMCVGKMLAYRAVGKDVEAKHWAGKLMEQLKVAGLLP